MGTLGAFKRRLLRKAYLEAVKSEEIPPIITIGDWLDNYSDQLLSEVEGGKVLSGLSTNGTSSNFATSESAELSTKNQIKAVDDLIGLYEKAIVVLKEPTNRNVYIWMMMRLADRRSIQFEEIFHPRIEIVTPER